jgi:hypothetical protein
MKARVRDVCLLCILCVDAVNAFALDREAFTFTNYDLNVRIEPDQQRLGVRGKITLRNDTQMPQKIAVLQVSSSLDWRSIEAGGQPVQFVSQIYTSDIDHTGALSEAIVTLPQAVAPQGTVELEIAYEGVVLLDATRLTRIGTPEAAANSTDWDQISAKFTAVRGVGYVAWYPIATDAADLAEADGLFDVVGRWKSREAGSKMEVTFDSPTVIGDAASPVTLCGGTDLHAVRPEASAKVMQLKCSYHPLGLSVPAFVAANYGVVERPSITVYNLPEHAVAAEAYAEAAEKASGLITDWFGALRTKSVTADLIDPSAAPFESGALLLTPLTQDAKLSGLVAAHQLTHAAFESPRPWIEEGLAHFAQALFLERQRGRQSALDYMGLHRSSFAEAEKRTTTPRSEDDANRSLVNTTNEELYRSKAMYVWWMLRDMLGDPALKKAFAAYHVEQDQEPAYMPRLIQAQTKRELEWFFDDWVYCDRGLPDFKVDSAFSRTTMNNAHLLTITVENLGAAGAEVPLTVRFAGGEIGQRLEVRAKSKAVTRVETPAAPFEIVLNDGSVPESDVTNNTFKIEAEQK